MANHFERYAATGTPTRGDDTLDGTMSWDIMFGWLGDDTLWGSAGRDYFIEGNGVWQGDSVGAIETGDFCTFGAGSDMIHGGSGWDYITYFGRETGITIDLEKARITSFKERDKVYSVEFVQATDQADIVRSVAGSTRRIDLEGGDDIVYAAQAGTRYFGGKGYDTIHLANSGTNKVHGVDYKGFEEVYGLREARNVILGGKADNIFSGGEKNDRISGGDGADLLRGLGGDDQISGGRGADTLSGGTGRDKLLGFGGADLIRGGAGRDRIEGYAGDDTIHGGGGDDVLFGDDGQDTIHGAAGDDRIFDRDGRTLAYGGGGADTFELRGGVAYGGAGDDIFRGNTDSGRYYGGAGQDLYQIDTAGRIVVFDPKGDNKVAFAGAVSLFLGGGNDIVNQTGRGLNYGIKIETGGGDDIVRLFTRFNSVDTGAGNDTIRLAAGDGDWIATGAGQDRVVLKTSGTDRIDLSIRDFNPRKDVIDLFGVTSFDDVTIEATRKGARVLVEHNRSHTSDILFEGLTPADLVDDLLV